MNSAKRINLLLNCSGVPVWQRNYYERIVRDDPANKAIRYYIQMNPANWDNDKENR
jgi:REP element-mobilizing transposase RayT